MEEFCASLYRCYNEIKIVDDKDVKDVIMNTKGFKCAGCNKSFTTRNTLYDHIQQNPKHKTYIPGLLKPQPQRIKETEQT